MPDLPGEMLWSTVAGDLARIGLARAGKLLLLAGLAWATWRLLMG
jgi:hypothetical protein